MKDIITKLLDLEPESISDISLVSDMDQQFALITLKKKFVRCPFCGRMTNRIHDYRERTITHAVLDDVELTIVYNQRRYTCPECRRSFSEPNPFASPGKRISRYTVLRVMRLLKDPKVTFEMAARQCNISTSSAIRIFDEHAGIKVRHLPVCLCIDEIYTSKYRQKTYACVLADMQTSQVYDLRPSRRKYELAAYLSSIDRFERERVQYVSMDMWPVYRELAELYFPNAKVCVDSFHVIQQLNNAMTRVRIRVMNHYPATSDEYYLLKHFSWILDISYWKVDLNRMIRLRKDLCFFDSRSVSIHSILTAIYSIDQELEIASVLKYRYERINREATSQNVSLKIDDFLQDADTIGPREFKNFARMIRRWRTPIQNSFDRYEGQRISNGPVESINSRIKSIKTNGNGYGNFARFRLRVMYSLNRDSSIRP